MITAQALLYWECACFGDKVRVKLKLTLLKTVQNESEEVICLSRWF